MSPHIVYGKSNEQQQRLGFTLAVCDLTGLAPEILATARQHAVRIVSSAGVAVTWLDLDSRAKCSIPNTASRHFVVVILPKAPSGWTSPDAMGLAPGRTGLHPRIAFQRYRGPGVTGFLSRRPVPPGRSLHA